MARSRPLSQPTPHAAVKPWRWALGGGGLGLLLAVLLFAPASWLAAAVERASAAQVRLADPRGTVWDGSAQLVLSGGIGSRDQAALPDRLTWRIRPGADGGSAGGWLSARLQALCCMAQPWRVAARPQWGGAVVTLADGQARLPALLLAGLGTPWNTLQPEGELTLSTQSLVIDLNAGRLVLGGQAVLEAMAVSSRLSTLKPMGSYRVTVAGGSTPTLKLETIEGALQLSGSGQWVGSRLRFDGVATAAPAFADALSNLLNIIGRRDGVRSLIKVG
ncbi:general secretion pathway protein GspN [Rhodoferax koreense]|uniref:Type II secretion system protein N n=1 Tax=Rhodoferax koreensis TaxID=1842727 RepID=A0A1P8JSU8_9BURK|nr:type II secretion system protein N [Rhodoferax koreense]APW36808.1 general secretion pathway protein GspN [Rhodoferax koreense]